MLKNPHTYQKEYSMEFLVLWSDFASRVGASHGVNPITTCVTFQAHLGTHYLQTMEDHTQMVITISF